MGRRVRSRVERVAIIAAIAACRAAAPPTPPPPPPAIDLATPITAAGVETPSGLDWGAEGAKPAAQLFGNVSVLGALSGDRFMAAMQSMEANLGEKCLLCHRPPDFSSDQQPAKARARLMIRMVDEVNRRTFGGRARVTCWTCHRGQRTPGARPFPTELPEPFARMSDAELARPVEQATRDVTILTGMDVRSFGLIMQWFTRELGVPCGHCHDPHDFAATTPIKTRAREMLAMTGYLGKDFYADQSPIMCGTCHAGSPAPPRRQGAPSPSAATTGASSRVKIVRSPASGGANSDG
jgi:Photosynthetic reaction centre cytochrome C subunit